MFALLLIPILVSGYILVVANLYHYYQLHRYDGQLLYLKVAAHGTMSVVFVLSVALITKFFFPDFHPIAVVSETLNVKKTIDKNKVETWLALISIASIISSLIWVFLIWCKNVLLGFFCEKQHHKDIFHAKKLRILRKTISNSTLDSMLLDAMESRPKKSILVTLSSRKVYVGIVNGIQEPTESEAPNSYISIFPIMSGYRDKDTLSITFTNSYPSEVSVSSAATADSKKIHKIANMDILIKSDEISHLSWFDFAVFDEVNGSFEQGVIDLRTNASDST
ncbi:TPA: hypothetical protein ACMEW2_000320 [Klebsiella pneumoniae]|uniref:hypothetical protein n=1 Tax=Klebsiella pneumoniae complex TaxID=3390273 RepID=UPI000C79C772|nr:MULTISPECIES: hypothetical protein [Klebsiella]EKU9431494.1 hypothetical protein [Klebsiella variicola]HDH1429915.1 hypothetical protein [Klebsiella quasipneumoniae subsp. similipneumoniae]HDU5830989.1 hypothetical protein [Klebsiella pneumoniae subsp. pneumoniae]MCF1308376.1 hypothetical protein [Klebsiella quasipneumoniae]MDL4672615.1 hypothetical protein [Klebsiella pneumoniae]